MAFLPNYTNSNDGTFYFAKKQSGSVVEPGFTATGTGGVVPFVAQNIQDTGAGIDQAIVLQNQTPTSRWAVGVAGVESGGDAGSNLTFVGYNDAGNTLKATTQINRANGNLTEFGNVSAVFFGDNGNSSSLTNTASSAGVQLTARAGVGVVQAQGTICNGTTGFTNMTVVNPTLTSLAYMNVVNDNVKTGLPLGQVNMAVPPKVANQPLTMYVVSRGTNASTINATLTVPCGVSAEFLKRPFVRATLSITGANNDAVNPASITPSIVGITTQTGNPVTVAQANYDGYGNTQEFILQRGVDYDDTTLVFNINWAVVGRSVNNVYSIVLQGSC